MAQTSTSLPDDTETRDAFLGGRLHLIQPLRGNRAGHDAMLLAAAVAAERGETVSDFGCGSGAVGLAIAVRVPGLRLTLVDVDPLMVSFARRNADANGQTDAETLICDLNQSAKDRELAGVLPNIADHVAMNPPYLHDRNVRSSPDPLRARAFVANADLLECWVRAAAHHARPGGALTLVHRADRLSDVLNAIGTRFGGLAILPVHPHPEAEAHRIIVAGRAGSRAPLRILPPLTLHAVRGGLQTDATHAVLRDGEPLSLLS